MILLVQIYQEFFLVDVPYERSAPRTLLEVSDIVIDVTADPNRILKFRKTIGRAELLAGNPTDPMMRLTVNGRQVEMPLRDVRPMLMQLRRDLDTSIPL